MGSWTGWNQVPESLGQLLAEARRLQVSWEPSELQWGALSQPPLSTPGRLPEG